MKTSRLLIVTTAFCVGLAISAHATSRSWVGGGGNNDWGTAANWSPGGVPANGDTLNLGIFTATTTVNNLAGLRLKDLVLGHGDIITGNGIALSNGIVCAFGGVNEVGVEIELAAYQTFISQAGLLLISRPLNLAGRVLVLETDASDLTSVINFGGTDGRIYGTGNVYATSVNGNSTTRGEVQFSGNTASCNIDGFVRVQGYTRLTLKKNPGGYSINDRLQIGTNAIAQCYFAPQFAPAAQVVIESGGQLLGGGEDHQIADLELQESAMVDTEGGTLSVLGSLTAYATNSTPHIYGALAFSSSLPIRVHGPRYPGLDINANIVGAHAFAKYYSGTLRLLGTNTFNGSVTIAEGSVEALTPTAFGSTSSGVTLVGSGSLTLRGVAIGNEPLTISGDELQFTDTYGSLLFGFDNSSWAGPVTLNTNLVLYSGDTTILSGLISGPGGLDTFYDTVRLSGSSGNTYVGTTRVLAGTLELAKSTGNAIMGPLEIGDAVGGAGADVVRLLTGSVISTVPVTVRRSGLFDLNGFSDGIGPLTLNGGVVVTGLGTLTLGQNGNLTSLSSPVTASISGRLDLGNRTNTVTVEDGSASPDLIIDARISNGGITKEGAGVLFLSGTNLYSGATTVNDGIVVADNNSALGAVAGTTTVNDGGTLWLGANVSTLPEPLTLNGTGFGGTNGALIGVLAVTASGSVVLQSPSTIRAEGQFHVSGAISGTGPLTKSGPGSLFFSDSSENTYFGDTVVSDGTLYLNKPSNVISVPGHLIIGNGLPGSSAIVTHLAGSFTINGGITVNRSSLYNLNGWSESFTLALLAGQPPLRLNDGGDVQTGAGLLTLPADTAVVVEPGANGTSSISGRLGLSASIFSGSHTFAVNSALAPSGPTLTISAALEAITGNADVFKTGPGEMRLTGNNTFTGTLVANGGRVTLASSTALGASSGSVLVNSNAVLAVDGQFAFPEPLTLNSTAPASLVVLNGNANWNGVIALNQNSTVHISAGASLETSAAISGPGTLTKIGPGQLWMAATVANTYANTTWVKEGDLLLNSTVINGTILGPLIIGDGLGGANADNVYLARVRQIGNTVPVTINSSGRLYIWAGKSDAFGSLSGSGNVVFEGSNDLEVGLDDGSSLFSGIISGDGNFWKRGTGTMTLSGNNTYTGTTFVDGGGTLLVEGSQPLSPVELSGGATLGGSGTVGAITANNGIISPGASVGVLKCSSVAMDASCIFRVELNGTDAGTTHDRLDVNGTVVLGDAALHATLGFASAAGNTFRIVNKTVGGGIFTTFSGLSQGANFNISGIPFQISYTGGSGNDVVLTQLMPLPTLASAQVAGADFVFSWPTNYTGFVLEGNTNLSANVWTAVVPGPVISGSNYVATNSTSGPQGFFRLRSP